MKHLILYLGSILLLFLASQNIMAQEIYTEFINPSLEGFPRPGKSPYGWYSYDFHNESPPDIHPTTPPTFHVKNQPFDGNTYVGMVTRDNNTYESLTHLLPTPLIADTCYSFSIYLAQSKHYESATSWSGNLIHDFTAPTILKIWGGDSFEGELELLAQTPPISHLNWKKYKINFSPTVDVFNLMLEAYYLNPDDPKNGHILLDNLSNIEIIPCKQEENTSSNSTPSNDIFTIKSELFQTIKELGSKISFDGNKISSLSTKHLKTIGTQLFLVKDYKLLFYYKYGGRRNKLVRKKNIQKKLQQIGYPPHLFEVKAFDKKEDAYKYWMVKEYDFFIGLEMIKQ